MSSDPTTTSSEANKASSKLILASGEASSAAPDHQVVLSEVTHKGAKAKAHIFRDATSPTFYKAKAQSGDAKIASFGEANASHMSDEAISQAFLQG